MSASRWRRGRELILQVLDAAFFYSLVVLGQLLTIHGKATSSFLLVATHQEFVRPPANRWEIYLTVALSALAVSVVRVARWNSRGRVLLGALCAVSSPLVVRAYDQPSSLILFLDMFFLTFAAGVAWANSLLAQRMQIRYWEILFDNAVKAAQLLITAFGVLMAVLGVVTRKIEQEDLNGFLTTAAYPTMVVMLVLFLIAYWVILPIWQMMGKHYREQPADKAVA